jgi:hypothetical protein
LAGLTRPNRSPRRFITIHLTQIPVPAPTAPQCRVLFLASTTCHGNTRLTVHLLEPRALFGLKTYRIILSNEQFAAALSVASIHSKYNCLCHFHAYTTESILMNFSTEVDEKLERKTNAFYTYLPLTLYLRTGSRDISDIPSRHILAK